MAVVGCVLGIAIQSLSPLSLGSGFFIALLALVLEVVRRREHKALASAHLLLITVGLGCFLIGVLRFEVAERSLVTELDQKVNQKVTLAGEVVREPDVRSQTRNLYVKTDDTIVLVQVDRHQDIEYGDVLSVSGTLKRPEAFQTDLGRTFNYPGYLRSQGVTHTMSYAEVEIERRGEGNWFVSGLLQFKQALIDSFAAVIPEPQAGLGAGLLLGVKQALGDQLETVFRTAGIIHIVVLSGYNVMIVAEAVMRLLAVFFSVRTRVIIGVAAIASFALMVGLSATVVRASIMAAMVLVARAMNRTYVIVRALLVAGLIMLLLNPMLLIYDPGFQLSFLATLGLLFIAPKLEAALPFVPTRFQVREFLTATIATQLFVLPLLLYSIGEFSVVAVFVNVLVLPLVPLAMLFTFLTGVVGFLSSALALAPAFLANVLLLYIVGVAQRFADLPFASYLVPAFSFWWVLISYALLAGWLYLSSREDTVKSSVAHWTIEEEDNVKSGGSLREPPPQDTPVFFR